MARWNTTDQNKNYADIDINELGIVKDAGWKMVTMVLTTEGISFYSNGEKINHTVSGGSADCQQIMKDLTGASGFCNPEQTNVRLGASVSTYWNGADALIDDISFYGEALNEEEIKTLYDKTNIVLTPDQIKVQVDMDKTYQTMDGFGAAYTWYNECLVNNINAEKGFDWIFNDAEFNILRFRDNYRNPDNVQQTVEDYKQTYSVYYNAAIARGITPTVLVTNWGEFDRDNSFVQYVETDEGKRYYTLDRNENGEYMYDELAEFFVQSVQIFMDAGIPVHYFSISNEIEFQNNGSSKEDAGFYFAPEESEDCCAYWKAYAAVYHAFEEAFGEKAPSIIGAETMAGSVELLREYMTPLIQHHPEMVDVIAHHLYGSDLGEMNFSRLYNEFSDYRLWQSEWYIQMQEGGLEWRDGNDWFRLGDLIVSELVNENITAYLYWHGVWDENDKNCLIGVSTVDSNKDIFRRGGHYIMMHFSKFIKQGYQRVEVNSNMYSNTVAFKSPDGKKLVLVVANSTEHTEQLNFSSDENIVSSQVYQSAESFENQFFNDMGEYKSGLTIPSKSLTTVVFDIEEKEVGSISVTAPKKVEYLLGEELAVSGMKVTATYKDGTTEDITEGYEITGYDPEKVGKQTITVSYEGKEATFEVEILGLPFEDVTLAKECEWFYKEVYYNYHAGIMTGTDDTHFAPGANLARAQFAVILHRLNDKPAVEYTDKFPDVTKGVWYTDAILWAAGTGVVTGYTDSGFFGPSDHINREQMAVMMYRYAKYLEKDISAKADYNTFADAGDVSGFAKEAMSWSVGSGIITGKDNGTRLDPQGNASRAECAIIIQRFMDKYGI